MARKSILLTMVALAGLALAGCGSSSKAPTAIDTAPPLVPTGLVATADGTAIVVSWAPNTSDADFVGFVVRRTTHGQSVMLIDAPVDVTEWADDAPVAGVVNVYAVSAVDEAGNWSAYATVAVDLREGNPAPVPLSLEADETLFPLGEDDGPGAHLSDRHAH